MAGLPSGTLARFEGEWGVLTKDSTKRPELTRRFDRWHGGPIALRTSDYVDVPEKRR